jgi:cellulose synthase/poly-beta-1,6-N-acetylglucosamine synthase-like glycosyltransferase
VSVVVPSYRRVHSVRACLRALAAQTVPALEILVVLRADDHESRWALEQAEPPVRVLTVDRPGQVAALNCGCDAARGAFIAITDDDAVPRPDWIQAIVARFATDPRIGAVGGRDIVHHVDGIVNGDTATVGRVRWWGRRIGNHHLRSHLQDVDFLKGADMAFRAAARQPFDQHLEGNGAQVCNDLEATWSVRRRGWRVVYDPAVVVDHYPAQRHDEDGRGDQTLRAQRDQEHNEVFALLRHASWWHRPILLGYRLLVGTRDAPGLILSVHPGIPLARRGRIPALTKSRLSALRTLRSAPRRPPPSAPCGDAKGDHLEGHT